MAVIRPSTTKRKLSAKLSKIRENANQAKKNQPHSKLHLIEANLARDFQKYREEQQARTNKYLQKKYGNNKDNDGS